MQNHRRDPEHYARIEAIVAETGRRLKAANLDRRRQLAALKSARGEVA